jgi:hypothetical protein
MFDPQLQTGSVGLLLQFLVGGGFDAARHHRASAGSEPLRNGAADSRRTRYDGNLVFELFHQLLLLRISCFEEWAVCNLVR